MRAERSTGSSRPAPRIEVAWSRCASRPRTREPEISNRLVVEQPGRIARILCRCEGKCAEFKGGIGQQSAR